MRLIRRLLLLTIVGVGGVAAFNYWSQHGWAVRPGVARLEAQIAKREATKLATQAAARANDAASKAGDTLSDSTLTAKIKSRWSSMTGSTRAASMSTRPTRSSP